VLNESMNSACAVVANQEIGSVPFLVKNGENGFTYKDIYEDELYNKIKILLDDKKTRLQFSKKAYLTITEEWNAQSAAKKFIALCEQLLSDNTTVDIFEFGICSKVKTK